MAVGAGEQTDHISSLDRKQTARKREQEVWSGYRTSKSTSSDILSLGNLPPEVSITFPNSTTNWGPREPTGDISHANQTTTHVMAQLQPKKPGQKVVSTSGW